MPPPMKFQAPTGTRDVYPADAAKRLLITNAWRRASLIHGFDEIDGPTFEHLELYTAKSGPQIVSELFSFRRSGGEKDYALRPEFTPTLARLYAARAGSLPKPCRWFTLGAFFRAERPQRGRLREFLQWNLDVLADPTPAAEVLVLAACVRALESLGLTSEFLEIRLSDRRAIARMLAARGVREEQIPAALGLLDQRGKTDEAELARGWAQVGLTGEALKEWLGVVATSARASERSPSGVGLDELEPLHAELAISGLLPWCTYDPSLARGLAYYTGCVFEIHARDGSWRAVAGGGRYDKLIESLGGPATPAVGLGMGDAVLAALLEDRTLMPEGTLLLERAGLRPDVFVIAPGQAELTRSVLADLRRQDIHARASSKSTTNLGKLLQDASASGARLAAILESPTHARLKDLDTQAQDPDPIPLVELASHVRSRLGSR